MLLFISCILKLSSVTEAAAPIPKSEIIEITQLKPTKQLKTLNISKKQISKPSKNKGILTFDFPITYNDSVKEWIYYYQTRGRKDFSRWLERSQKYLPHIQNVFKQSGLPADLAYLAMVESGFSPFAISSADAVGYWQFIEPTATRFGLRVNWWLDERRDIIKSTKAAALYLKKLHDMFDSWYLAIASYNTGENRIRRLVEKYRTKNFWVLAEKDGLVSETKDYIPKMLATVLIAKAPALYGFRDIKYEKPIQFDYFWAPGGLSLTKLALSSGMSEKDLIYLNPELIRKYIPDHISGHQIRIPRDSLKKVSQYLRSASLK